MRDAAVLTLLLALGGCKMVPKYERPEAPVAEPFHEGDAAASEIEQLAWREVLVDPQLRSLVEQALTNNRDLRIAILNVEAARAAYRIQRSEIIPQVEGTASVINSRTSGNSFPNSFQGAGITRTNYQLGVGLVSYELDLFGRVRSANEQAVETYLALEETRRAAQLSLVAEIAAQYITLREYQEQLQLAQETRENAAEVYGLVELKAETGVIPADDLATVGVQLHSADVEVKAYERLVAQATNALEALVGAPVSTLAEADGAAVGESVLAELPSGLPSDLLQRRPDILAAEHQLLAANANIGAARAAFFPTIALTGSAGLSSASLGNLFAPGSVAWSVGPSVTVPIFSGGRNKANLEQAKVLKRIEIARYEKAIQTAFREVSDALVARESYVRQLEAQQELVEVQTQRFDLATGRYDAGVEDALAVLTAQQDLYSSQASLITARAEQRRNLVTLYKALGGGWDPNDVSDEAVIDGEG